MATRSTRIKVSTGRLRRAAKRATERGKRHSDDARYWKKAQRHFEQTGEDAGATHSEIRYYDKVSRAANSRGMAHRLNIAADRMEQRAQQASKASGGKG